MDIVFTRCKPAGSRRLSFKEFLDAITIVAEEAGWDFETILASLSKTTSRAPSNVNSPKPSGHGGLPRAYFEARAQELPRVHRSSISDLTDNKLGPQLPHFQQQQQSRLAGGSPGSGGSSQCSRECSDLDAVRGKLRFGSPERERGRGSPGFVHRGQSSSRSPSPPREAAAARSQVAPGQLGAYSRAGSVENPLYERSASDGKGKWVNVATGYTSSPAVSMVGNVLLRWED